MLPKIYKNVLNVIAEAQKGTASSFGYTDLFKTHDNSAYVVSIFKQIALGAPCLDNFGTVVAGAWMYRAR